MHLLTFCPAHDRGGDEMITQRALRVNPAPGRPAGLLFRESLTRYDTFLVLPSLSRVRVEAHTLL